MVKHHVSMRFRARWQAGVNWFSTGDFKGVSPSGLDENLVSFSGLEKMVYIGSNVPYHCHLESR